MTKVAQPGAATQKGGKQLSLEARIDAVVTLAWMADGMRLPPGAIGKVADASIVLENGHPKNLVADEGRRDAIIDCYYQKTGTKTQKPLLMRPWCYKSKVLTLVFGDQFVILPQIQMSQLGLFKA